MRKARGWMRPGSAAGLLICWMTLALREPTARHGNAVLVSAEDYAALREGAYLLRSPANARRLLKAYQNALNGLHVAEHALIDPDAADAR